MKHFFRITTKKVFPAFTTGKESAQRGTNAHTRMPIRKQIITRNTKLSFVKISCSQGSANMGMGVHSLMDRTSFAKNDLIDFRIYVFKLFFLYFLENLKDL